MMSALLILRFLFVFSNGLQSKAESLAVEPQPGQCQGPHITGQSYINLVSRAQGLLECHARCISDPSCKYYSYGEIDVYCWLYAECPSLSGSPGSGGYATYPISIPRDASPIPQQYGDGVCEGPHLIETSYANNLTVVQGLLRCRSDCKSNPACEYYNFGETDVHCWLYAECPTVSGSPGFGEYRIYGEFDAPGSTTYTTSSPDSNTTSPSMPSATTTTSVTLEGELQQCCGRGGCVTHNTSTQRCCKTAIANTVCSISQECCAVIGTPTCYFAGSERCCTESSSHWTCTSSKSCGTTESQCLVAPADSSTTTTLLPTVLPPVDNVLLEIIGGNVNCGELPTLVESEWRKYRVHKAALPNINMSMSIDNNPNVYGYQTGNNWIGRFTGLLTIKTMGKYSFTLSLGNADTASISIDGNEVARSGCTWDSSFGGDAYLVSGEHLIQVLYTDDGWTDKAALAYQGPDTAMSYVVVPAERFVSWRAHCTEVSCLASTQSGECVGNDSRCRGSNNAKCKSLGTEGADCNWVVPNTPGASGTCVGNDSRCGGSGHAKCIRLSNAGSDCRWQSPSTSGSSGTCLGNDSRCSGTTQQTCDLLTQEGSDCKWRSAFSVNGSMIMTASDVVGATNSTLVKYAVVDALSNVTGVPSQYVDADITTATEDKKRRLRAHHPIKSVPSTSGNLTITYVISVPGDAPSTVQATGAEVGERLQVTPHRSTIERLISSNVAEAQGSETFTLSISNTSEPEVSIDNQSQGPARFEHGTFDSGARMETFVAHVTTMSIFYFLSS